MNIKKITKVVKKVVRSVASTGIYFMPTQGNGLVRCSPGGTENYNTSYFEGFTTRGKTSLCYSSWKGVAVSDGESG